MADLCASCADPAQDFNATMTASTLMVRGLKKHYGARQVVHDVSLRLDSGEVVGLLGPNGAGKTTSFYMIVGLVPSDAGEGVDLFSLSKVTVGDRALA